MNKLMRIALYGICALIYCGGAQLVRAQHDDKVMPETGGAEVRRLTLSEAVRLALQNNREVLLAQADVSRAIAEHKEARSPFRPQVFVGSGLAATKGFPLTLEGAAPSIFQLSGSQALLNANLRNAVRQASHMQIAAEKSLEDKRDEIIARTVLTYLDLDRSRRSLQYVQAHTQSLAQAADIMGERVLAGLESPVEGTRAQLNAARSRSEAVALGNQIAMLEFALRDLTGIPQAQPLALAPAELPALAAGTTMDELVRRAFENHAGLQALEEQIRAKEFQVRSEQALKWPRVNLVGQYGLFSDINNFSQFFRQFSRNNATIGFSVMMPLWDRYRTSALVSKAEAELAATRLQWDGARAGIARQIRQLWGEVQQQAAAQEVARLELEVSRRSLDAVLAQYEDGRVNRLKVEQVRSQENQSWVNFFQASYGAEKARLELLRLSGQIRSLFQ